MVDMASIASAVQSLNAAGELVKGFVELKTTADRQAKVIELQRIILGAQASALSAQSDQLSMLEQIRALKEEVAKVKAWETEKQRYELHKTSAGSFTYALKQEAQDSELPHHICTACYQEGKKSILQRIPRNTARDALGMHSMMRCPVCKTEIGGE